MEQNYSYMNGIVHNVQNVHVGDEMYVNLDVRVQDDIRHLIQDDIQEDVGHHIQVTLPSSYYKQFEVNDAVEMKIDEDGFLADICKVGPQVRNALISGMLKHESFNNMDFNIVRIKHFDILPMSPEEAILQMNLLDHDFFVFNNSAENNTFTVLYKRRSGGYGLIASNT